MTPKISCLTVTTGRVDLIKKSITCYINQTYKNKELIVLSQGTSVDNQLIKEFVHSLNRQDILFIEAPRSLTLGGMRNLTCEIATGEILCQWDDDDLYHPHRLMAQYKALLGQGVVASCYSQHLKYYTNTHELYWVDWSQETPFWRTLLCGSVMFYKHVFYIFKNQFYPSSGRQSDREEDLNVLLKLDRIGKIVPIRYGYHYTYVFHGENTYDLNHHNLVLDKRIMDVNELLLNRTLLTETFKLVGLEDVIVKSLDSVAFEV